MKKWILSCVFLLVLTYITFHVARLPSNKPHFQVDQNKLHYASYKHTEFYTGLENPPAVEILTEKVYGGIVSHHFFVERKIAEFFLPLKNQHPKTVVIIAPNHFNAGNANILISEYAYDTPYGILEPDMEVENKLLRSGIVKAEEQPFENEHSISTLVGFVKHTFPKAKLVPIILKRNTPQEKLDELASKLDTVLSQDCLVVASVDFSHHLNRIAAQFHDDRSILAIENFDFDSLKKLEIDSPPSIYTLLKYLQMRQAQKLTYQNTNSTDFSGQLDSEDVTSYLFAYFFKGKPKITKGVSILSFGDSMFDREIKNVILQKNQDPFERISGVEGNFFRGIDFISTNLEGPITSVNLCSTKNVIFKFPVETARLLKRNGINIVNLANNHTLDCGLQGMQDTRKNLRNFNISYFGNHKMNSDSYSVKQVNNNTIVFLGINTFSLTPSDQEKLFQLISDLELHYDFIVVNVHWGIEYNLAPSLDQKELAHKLVDSGADLILGHHPHVIQSLEDYKNKAIFYSLGNFVFDQTTSETTQGLGVGAVFTDKKQKLYLFPIEIKNYFPVLLPYHKMQSFCDNFLYGLKITDDCTIEL